MQILREEEIAWHIEARHLEEAEFCCKLWTSSHDSPRDDLAGVTEGPEARMLVCRSRGVAELDTRALGRHQREQLREIARLPPLDFQSGSLDG